MTAEVTVVAIGGGGCTHGTDPLLDDAVLAASPALRPRIGYLGAANGDDPLRIGRFRARFGAAGLVASHLPASSGAATAREWLAGQDVVYVGGGNTLRLLEGWRESGIAEALVEAARRGTVLAGVSAGGVCWFEYALSDAGGNGLQPLAGLGLVAGSCCPHFSSEPARQEAFPAAIGAGRLPDGIAIDDGVAVVCRSGQPPRVVSARPGHGAWSFRRTPGGVRRSALAPLHPASPPPPAPR